MKRNLEDYTPELLEKDYINVAVLITMDASFTRGTAKVIKQHANEILSYYKEHNTLKGFTVPGKIGPKVTERLELIFKEGIEGAREVFRKRKDDELKKIPRYWKGSTPRGKKEYHNNSWDNAVRTREGD